jgi:hypothetical protein
MFAYNLTVQKHIVQLLDMGKDTRVITMENFVICYGTGLGDMGTITGHLQAKFLCRTSDEVHFVIFK